MMTYDDAVAPSPLMLQSVRSPSATGRSLRRRTMKASRRAAALALAATAVVGSGVVAQSPAAVDLGPATGDVTALMIGWPDRTASTPPPASPRSASSHLEELFEAKHPDIDLNIVNIPYGAGSTGYGPKTESMVQANEACVYHMPASYDYAQAGCSRTWMCSSRRTRRSRTSGRVTSWRTPRPGRPTTRIGHHLPARATPVCA